MLLLTYLCRVTLMGSKIILRLLVHLVCVFLMGNLIAQCCCLTLQVVKGSFGVVSMGSLSSPPAARAWRIPEYSRADGDV